MNATVRYVARSDNAKTGDIPTAWIGATRAESLATCEAVGCSLLASKRCYAQWGTPAMAHASTVRGAERGRPYDPETALQNRHHGARAVRIGAIGDPAMADRTTLGRFVSAARKLGLAVLGYTHGWRMFEAQDLRHTLMASCDTLRQVDLAIATGWRATVVIPTGEAIPRRSLGGHRIVLCPAQATDGRVTCNTCRACDASRPGPVIAFREH